MPGGPPTRDDHALLSAWAHGDVKAGDEIASRYYVGIYEFFARRVGDAAEDLAQQTLLAGLEAHQRFREGGSLRAYLFGIARKQLLKFFERAKKKSALDSDALLVDGRTSPTEKLARDDAEQLLMLALRELPLDFQIAVELFYWEELSGAEVAEVLDVAEGTVWSRLTRAKHLLRDKIVELSSSGQLAETTISRLDQWAARLRETMDREDPG